MATPSDAIPAIIEHGCEFRLMPITTSRAITDRGCFVCGSEFNHDIVLHQFVGSAPTDDEATRIRKQCFPPNNYGVEVIQQPVTNRTVAIYACKDHLPNLAILFKLVETTNKISAPLVEQAKTAVITFKES